MQISEIKPGIVLASKHLAHVRSTSLGFWVRSGVVNEPDALQGASHFLEHLLFKGTKCRSARDISESFDNIGGEVNAYTAKEYTCFYSKVVDQHLETAVDVLTDMLSNARLDADDIAKERKVILEEISMYEDSPGEYVHDLLATAVWQEHSLGKAILGTRSSVKSMETSDLRAFYREHYCQGNIIIAAAGKLDHDQLAVWLQDRLNLPVSRLEKQTTIVPATTRAESVFIDKATEQLHLALGFPGLSISDERRYAWNLLSNILGSGMSSRLFQRLREEHALVYNAYTYTASFQQAGYSALYLGLNPLNSEVALQLIARELKEITSQPVTAAELSRAKEQVKGSMIMGLESTANHMGRLGRGLLLLGRVQPLDAVIEGVEAVSADDILSLAQDIFCREKMAVAAVGKVEGLAQIMENTIW